MLIRPAQAHEAALVADILSAAAAHIRSKGEIIWDPAEVSQATVEPHVRGGMYHIAFDDDGPVGVFRFQLEDRFFWPEIPEGSSAFVHKLAVHPGKQGAEVAQALLAHACELARQRGRPFLRLDCMSGKPSLRAVYERFGFRLHSQKELDGFLFDRFELAVI
jgi:GNAT superfamily N-acetyltransferase